MRGKYTHVCPCRRAVPLKPLSMYVAVQVFRHSRSHDLSPWRLVAEVRVERSCQKRRDKWLHKAV